MFLSHTHAPFVFRVSAVSRLKWDPRAETRHYGAAEGPGGTTHGARCAAVRALGPRGATPGEARQPCLGAVAARWQKAARRAPDPSAGGGGPVRGVSLGGRSGLGVGPGAGHGERLGEDVGPAERDAEGVTFRVKADCSPLVICDHVVRVPNSPPPLHACSIIGPSPSSQHPFLCVVLCFLQA